MKIIVFIREKSIIYEILNAIGEPTKPPVLSQPRAPPLWEEYLSEPSTEFMLSDALPDYCYVPLFGYEFDQRIS